MPSTRTVGQNVARRRFQLGWSRDELARRVPALRSEIIALEEGGQTPPIAFIARVALALRSSTAALISAQATSTVPIGRLGRTMGRRP